MNELKHPCASKCPEYKDEQCNHCLVKVNCHQSMGTRTKNDNSDDSLLTIDVFQPSEFYWLIGGELVQANFIRLATTAERHANRRLTKDEQSLAEVS